MSPQSPQKCILTILVIDRKMDVLDTDRRTGRGTACTEHTYGPQSRQLARHAAIDVHHYIYLSTPPSQYWCTRFAGVRAQPTGPWNRCRRPSWPSVGTLKRLSLAAPRRRPLWSRSAARRRRVMMRHAADTVKQQLFGGVDGCNARRMLACVRAVDAQQLSPWP